MRSPKHIFIGGYTKSGTTYIGRAFDLINNVYARGEMDYFRIFGQPLGEALVEFTQNIQIVNKEVYDGFGKLDPLTNRRARTIHQQLFHTLFFNSQPTPDDCRVIVEKSPRNIFHMESIRFCFPEAKVVCVYRDPTPVFRSLMRHMSDHRGPEYLDPSSDVRRDFFQSFVKDRWPVYARIIHDYRDRLFMVRYDNAANDPAAFLDFAQREVIGENLGLKAGIETLSKDYYLASLPPAARAKSLVQKGTEKIIISDEEQMIINQHCAIPDISFDF